MKHFLTFLAVCMLFACNDAGQHAESDSGLADYQQPNDPFRDLDPDGIGHEETTDNDRPSEKWFGLDSDDDTVIYEEDGKILTSGYVTGTFERIDRGDFLHFVVRDSNDYLHSFFMNTGDQRQMDKYFEGYQPARGHPVIVKWIRGPLQVSDGGAMKTLYQAKEIIE